MRAKHLPALTRVPAAQVVAVCDIDTDRLHRVAALFHIPHACADISELLALDGVDAIGVCTDPGSHPELAITALGAGKHVLVEKPLALTPAECRRMIEASERSNAVAMTGFHMRFHRLVQQLRQHLEAGAAGDIESIRLVWHSPRGDAGIPAWKTKRAHGGGALVEIAVHHLDLVRYLTGAPLEQIHAMPRHGVREDECVVVSGRTTTGILISGEFSERSPHEIEIVVNGNAGSIRADCLRFDGLEIRSIHEVPSAPAVRLRSLLRTARELPTGLGIQRLGGDYRVSYQRQWAHFVESIRSGTRPASTFTDGLHATEALAAAAQSTLTGAATRIGDG